SPRVASRTPQVTHSMTEVISYDTRQAPITAPAAPPRPHQRSIPPQVIEPAQINHHAIEPAAVTNRVAPPAEHRPRRYGLLIASVFIALLVVAGAAFMFLKQSRALSSMMTTPTTPAPTVSPTPALPQEDARLKRARDAEKEERYKDAIILYGEYLVDHAL